MLAVPRNAMPSLHVAWMLLLFWNTLRRAWWIRFIAAVYLVLTALATLGLGEHYLADLMVAPALVAAIQAACTHSAVKEKWIALAAGTAITLFWLAALRSGGAMMIAPGAPLWSLALLSCILPLTVLRMLDRATLAHGCSTAV
jgi:hypothetical protein